MGQEHRKATGALAALLAGILPASAFDCAKARLPVEKTICGDAMLKASDEAMEAAFEAMRTGLDGEERKNALDDQRAWLKDRNDGCTTEPKPGACLLKRNEARTGLLTARPDSGPGFDRRPRAVLVRQAGSRTRIAVSLQLYRFAQPQTPGERTLTAEADRTLSGTKRVKDEPDDMDWSYDESWTISYASPTFLSITRTRYDYSGGAHGIGGTAGLNIDMTSGRVLSFADLFDKAAAAQLSKLCLKQIRAEKKERGSEGDEYTDIPKAVGEIVGDLANWTFKEREASVSFDPYSVGPYAEGAYACTFPIDAVNGLSKRAMPLR